MQPAYATAGGTPNLKLSSSVDDAAQPLMIKGKKPSRIDQANLDRRVTLEGELIDRRIRSNWNYYP